jgi:hypothetical protein
VIASAREEDLRSSKSGIIVAPAQNAHNFPAARGIGQPDHMKRFISYFIAGSLLAAATAAAQTQPPAPAVRPLPADNHEGITLSVDAYTRAERSKEKFGKANPLVVGILPVEIFFKNDTNLPVKLDMDTIELEYRPDGGPKQDVDWLPPIEVATAVAHPGGPSAPKARRFPIGVSVPKDDKRDKMLAILKPFAFDSDILPPNATIHGFFFFDVAGRMPAPGEATLYVPDLKEATSNKTLMFFEVPIENTFSEQ